MTARLLVRAVAIAALLILGLLAVLGPASPAQAAASPARKMVTIARGELARGVREVPAGSNRGPRIRIESVYRDGTLTTIEGNSSNRVARRWRRWGEASGYVRVATGGAIEAPGRRVAPRPRPKMRDRLVARISVYPSTTVAVGQAVGFSANDSSGDIASYRWDLDGDGRYDDARGDNAERTYRRAGAVAVGLRVRDRRGRTRTAKATVDVRVNQAPEARLDLPRTAGVDTKVQASAEQSSDPDGRIVKYEWDMDGDGAWETGGSRHEFTYRRPGVHAVGLRVTDDQGAVTEKVGTVEITQKPPTARASAPSRVPLGADAVLDGSRSHDPDGGVTSWSWDVDGDGVIDAEGARATWRFVTPGSRDVRLTVRDAWGAEASTSVPVEVVNQAPSPVVAIASKAIAGEEVAFDGTRSADADGTVVAWDWDFDGDGRWDATGPHARWRFAGDGERKVRLRVTDQWGASRATETTVRLLRLPVAVATLLTADPVAGTALTFSAEGSHDPDGSLERWDWDFNSDGRVDLSTTHAGKRVQAIYTRRGTHTVRLTVTDRDGLQAGTSLPVTVR